MVTLFSYKKFTISEDEINPSQERSNLLKTFIGLKVEISAKTYLMASI